MNQRRCFLRRSCNGPLTFVPDIFLLLSFVNEDYLVIFGATIGGMLGMLCILMLYRHCLKRREYAYTRVYHGLDPEEKEFKRNLENQTDEIDDLFDFGANEVGDADDEFDAKDLKQLEMLDTYRSNLVGSNGILEGDDEDDEPTGRRDEVLDASV